MSRCMIESSHHVMLNVATVSKVLVRVANPRPVGEIKTGRVSQPITDAADATGRGMQHAPCQFVHVGWCNGEDIRLVSSQFNSQLCHHHVTTLLSRSLTHTSQH